MLAACCSCCLPHALRSRNTHRCVAVARVGHTYITHTQHTPPRPQALFFFNFFLQQLSIRDGRGDSSPSLPMFSASEATDIFFQFFSTPLYQNLSDTLVRTVIYTRFPALSLARSLFLSLFLSLSLSLSHTHILSLSLSLSHTHTHTPGLTRLPRAILGTLPLLFQRLEREATQVLNLLALLVQNY